MVTFQYLKQACRKDQNRPFTMAGGDRDNGFKLKETVFFLM